MRTHAMPFNAEMARANIEGRKTHTMRPMKVPCNCDILTVENEMVYWMDNTVSPFPYAVGDIIWQREIWGWVPDVDQEVVDRYITYKCDCMYADIERFYSPATMPRWACRWWGVILDVQPLRVWDITEEQAIAEGLETIGPLDDGHYVFKDYLRPSSSWCYEEATRSFHSLWDSIYAKRGLGWDANPWCWGISYEACQRPEGGNV